MAFEERASGLLEVHGRGRGGGLDCAVGVLGKRNLARGGREGGGDENNRQGKDEGL